MGWASGMTAGSAMASRAIDAYNNSADRIKRDKQEADIQAELAKLEGTKAPMNAPRAEFGAQGGAGLPGFSFGAPQGGEITSAPTDRAQGLALSQGAPLSSAPGVATTQGFQVAPMELAPQGPTDSERERIYGNVARIKGDIAGMRQADQNGRTFKFKETFSSYVKDYDPNDEEKVGVGIRHMNTNDGIVTVGEPDKKGYRDMSYVDSDGKGKFAKLSPSEQAQVYAAAQMMGDYPEESIAKIRDVNKELGDALARRNSSVTGVTGANNTVNNLRNDDTRADKTLASQEQYRKDQNALGWARIQQDGAHQAAVRGGIRAQGRQYQVEDGNGRRGLFTPTRFDKDGLALLPDGYRYVTEDGQGGRGGADAGLKVNSDGSVIQNGVLYVPGADGTYKPAKGLGPSALDKALGALKAGGGVPAPERGMPFIGEPSPGFRFASQQEMRSQPAVNPDNLERVSKRGMFGGVNYEYLDRATGKSYSVDEYNQMLSN